MKKGSGQDYYQISVRFSPELGKLIQQIAIQHGRSFSKEVVRLVEAQLIQEKGTLTSALEEKR